MPNPFRYPFARGCPPNPDPKNCYYKDGCVLVCSPGTRPSVISAATAQAISRGARVPGTTKRQRRAVRKAMRSHPSCPPEAPFRCHNGQCVKHWTYCPDKLTR